jgi:acetyl-CoA carboxylase/biotin carboxylase 1
LILAFQCCFSVVQAYAEIESMKMFMPLLAGEAGMVKWLLTEGAALNPGDLLATMQLDFPEKVKVFG